MGGSAKEVAYVESDNRSSGTGRQLQDTIIIRIAQGGPQPKLDFDKI